MKVTNQKTVDSDGTVTYQMRRQIRATGFPQTAGISLKVSRHEYEARTPVVWRLLQARDSLRRLIAQELQ